jgi:hypothetical protein
MFIQILLRALLAQVLDFFVLMSKKLWFNGMENLICFLLSVNQFFSNQIIYCYYLL